MKAFRGALLSAGWLLSACGTTSSDATPVLADGLEELGFQISSGNGRSGSNPCTEIWSGEKTLDDGHAQVLMYPTTPPSPARPEPEYATAFYVGGTSMQIRECWTATGQRYSLILNLDYYSDVPPNYRFELRGEYDDCAFEVLGTVSRINGGTELVELGAAQLCGEPLSLSDFEALGPPLAEGLDQALENQSDL